VCKQDAGYSTDFVILAFQHFTGVVPTFFTVHPQAIPLASAWDPESMWVTRAVRASNSMPILVYVDSATDTFICVQLGCRSIWRRVVRDR